MVNAGQHKDIGHEQANAVDLQAKRLQLLNEKLRERGIRFKVERLRKGIFVRGTFPLNNGSKIRKRVSLGLKAAIIQNDFSRVEDRAIQLDSKIKQLGYLPEDKWWETKFEVKPTPGTTTVAEALEELEADFWTGRAKSNAAQRTWNRMNSVFKLLPPGADLTTDLLVGYINTTEAGTNSRIKICQYYKRLGKLMDLRGLTRIDELVGKYKPATIELPDEEHLLELVESLRSDKKWGWCFAALYIYGCRPSEVFSLRVNDNGTGTVLSLKRKEEIPEWRTCLALPQHLVASFEMSDVNRPYVITKPEEYDSMRAAELVNQWGKWLRDRRGHMGCQLYHLRHSWAVRSIKSGTIQTGLASKCMGHDIETHVKTYARYLGEKDVAEVAAKLI